MKKWVSSMIIACVLGVLGALPKAGAMELCPDEIAMTDGALSPQEKGSVVFQVFRVNLLSEVPRGLSPSYCMGLRSVCIPIDVLTLPVRCFAGHALLSALTFGGDSGLERIRVSAFRHCSSLSSICIPASVRILGRNCFSHCTSLFSVTLEQGSRLERVGESAFENCSNLQSTWIPEGMEIPNVRYLPRCPLLVLVTLETQSLIMVIRHDWTPF
ncbi:MAG: leucine-rich repeat domain-containing protein [Holosporales bacterium]|nr:leucine-rich repeat domain-containing protein [Holosporales bacterium]